MLRGVRILALLLFCLGGALRSQGAFPRPLDKYVNDYAGALLSEDRRELEAQLQHVDHDTGIEITVVVIPRVADYDPSNPVMKDFAKAWFNTWGIGKRATNDGILFLVSVEDRRCRIQLGSGYGKELEEALVPVMEQSIVPAFKEARYAAGIHAGVDGIVAKVTRKVQWWERSPWIPWLLGLGGLQAIAALIMLAMGRKGWFGVLLFGSVVLLFAAWALASSDRSGGSDFGGGSSDGGGVDGSW
jgi:uncharacterized protein